MQSYLYSESHEVTEPTIDSRTAGFLVASTVLHVGLAAAVLLLAVNYKPFELPPVTEIEIVSDTLPTSAGIPVPASKLPAPLKVAEVSQSPKETPVVVVKKKQTAHRPLPKPKAAAPKLAKVLSRPKPTPKAIKAVAVAKESDVEAALKEADDFAKKISEPVAVKEEEYNDSSLNADFDKVEKESQEHLRSMKKDLDDQTDQALKEHDKEVQEIQEQNKKEAAAIAAAAAAAAQRRADELAALKSAGASAAGGTGSGSPNGQNIRSLSELNQLPGNKKPQYDYEDRLARREGEIVFLTYISTNGRPTEFRMVKGTGHRSLDYKTLQALRTWKFYAGQEGWVEIPFRWDLKGGPQEMPATLRR